MSGHEEHATAQALRELRDYARTIEQSFDLPFVGLFVSARLAVIEAQLREAEHEIESLSRLADAGAWLGWALQDALYPRDYGRPVVDPLDQADRALHYWSAEDDLHDQQAIYAPVFPVPDLGGCSCATCARFKDRRRAESEPGEYEAK